MSTLLVAWSGGGVEGGHRAEPQDLFQGCLSGRSLASSEGAVGRELESPAGGGLSGSRQHLPPPLPPTPASDASDRLPERGSFPDSGKLKGDAHLLVLESGDPDSPFPTASLGPTRASVSSSVLPSGSDVAGGALGTPLEAAQALTLPPSTPSPQGPAMDGEDVGAGPCPSK